MMRNQGLYSAIIKDIAVHTGQLLLAMQMGN